MTAQELMKILVKAGVVADTIDSHYDDTIGDWVERTGPRTAGCGCCSILAELPQEVIDMYQEAEAS